MGTRVLCADGKRKLCSDGKRVKHCPDVPPFPPPEHCYWMWVATASGSSDYPSWTVTLVFAGCLADGYALLAVGGPHDWSGGDCTKTKVVMGDACSSFSTCQTPDPGTPGAPPPSTCYPPPDVPPPAYGYCIYIAVWYQDCHNASWAVEGPTYMCLTDDQASALGITPTGGWSSVSPGVEKSVSKGDSCDPSYYGPFPCAAPAPPAAPTGLTLSYSCWSHLKATADCTTGSWTVENLGTACYLDSLMAALGIAPYDWTSDGPGACTQHKLIMGGECDPCEPGCDEPDLSPPSGSPPDDCCAVKHCWSKYTAKPDCTVTPPVWAITSAGNLCLSDAEAAAMGLAETGWVEDPGDLCQWTRTLRNAATCVTNTDDGACSGDPGQPADTVPIACRCPPDTAVFHIDFTAHFYDCLGPDCTTFSCGIDLTFDGDMDNPHMWGGWCGSPDGCGATATIQCVGGNWYIGIFVQYMHPGNATGSTVIPFSAGVGCKGSPVGTFGQTSYVNCQDMSTDPPTPMPSSDIEFTVSLGGGI